MLVYDVTHASESTSASESKFSAKS